MKFISNFIWFIILLFSCTKKMDVTDPYQMKPPYKLLNLFSRKIKPETGLVLRGYAYNWSLPKGYVKKGIGDFDLTYSLKKMKKDEISLEYARNLIVFLAENLLQDINLNEEIRESLDVYPFTSDLIGITIYFEDENRIDLGQGVAIAYLFKGKIKYEGYHIFEYSNQYPADGKHYLIHEESYADALGTVKKRGTLKMLSY